VGMNGGLPSYAAATSIGPNSPSGVAMPNTDPPPSYATATADPGQSFTKQADAASGAGGLDPNSLSPQDQLLLSSMLSQQGEAPAKKKSSWKKYLAIGAGLLTTIGLGFLLRSGLKGSNLKDQINAFKEKPGDFKDFHKKFELKDDKVTAPEKGDDVIHPNTYRSFLEDVRRAEDLPKFLKGRDIDEGHFAHSIIKDWASKNPVKEK
jgi:hypothetical protein